MSKGLLSASSDGLFRFVTTEEQEKRGGDMSLNVLFFCHPRTIREESGSILTAAGVESLALHRFLSCPSTGNRVTTSQKFKNKQTIVTSHEQWKLCIGKKSMRKQAPLYLAGDDERTLCLDLDGSHDGLAFQLEELSESEAEIVSAVYMEERNMCEYKEGPTRGSVVMTKRKGIGGVGSVDSPSSTATFMRRETLQKPLLTGAHYRQRSSTLPGGVQRDSPVDRVKREESQTGTGSEGGTSFQELSLSESVVMMMDDPPNMDESGTVQMPATVFRLKAIARGKEEGEDTAGYVQAGKEGRYDMVLGGEGDYSLSLLYLRFVKIIYSRKRGISAQVIGLQNMLTGKFMSRPHFSAELTSASLFRPHETINVGNTVWKMYKNGYKSSKLSPFYLGGKDGWTICVGHTDDPLTFQLEELTSSEMQLAQRQNPDYDWASLRGRLGETKLRGGKRRKKAESKLVKQVTSIDMVPRASGGAVGSSGSPRSGSPALRTTQDHSHLSVTMSMSEDKEMSDSVRFLSHLELLSSLLSEMRTNTKIAMMLVSESGLLLRPPSTASFYGLLLRPLLLLRYCESFAHCLPFLISLINQKQCLLIPNS